ncbi:HD domain-containing protein [Bacteroidota bacterium]
MKIIKTSLIEETKEYVSEFLDTELSKELIFHSKKHTIDVFNNAEIIAKHSGLNENDKNILLISALFHDLGYINSYDGHESESAKYAGEYLSSKGINESIIRIVKESILATRIPQNPKSKIAEILCDADLMQLTNENYFEEIDLMRLEWAKIGKADLSKKEFNLQSIEFFNSHNYCSEYGKKILEPKKQRTLQKIKEKVSMI